MSIGRLLVLFAAVAATRAAPLGAQGWRVEASAGRADYREVGQDVGSTSAILTVDYDAPTWLYLSGGAPLDSGGIPWASVGAGSRLARPWRTLTAGIDLAAHGYGYNGALDGASGGGATLAALPFVGLAAGPMALELHAGGLSHTTIFDELRATRTVFEGGANGSVPLQGVGSLQAQARLVADGDRSYPFLGAGVEIPIGPVAAWAQGGSWLADELEGSSWSVGARMDIRGLATARIAYEQEGPDPLYWNGLRRGWTIGVSRPLGRRVAASAAIPAAAGATAGRVPIRIALDESPSAPFLAGDFSDWNPLPMRSVDGAWEATVSLAPGVYHYAFKRADGTWFLPESIPNQKDDGFGGRHAVLIVSGS